MNIAGFRNLVACYHAGATSRPNRLARKVSRRAPGSGATSFDTRPMSPLLAPCGGARRARWWSAWATTGAAARGQATLPPRPTDGGV
eukprot:scaffold38607_cov32-Phaeocystis_antarctica.AAC.3